MSRRPQSETANAADPSQTAAVQAIAIENDLRGTCVTSASSGRGGECEVRGAHQGAFENLPDLAVLVEPLLMVTAGTARAVRHPASPLLAIVRDDEVCRR